MAGWSNNFSNNFSISTATIIVPETIIPLRKNIVFQDAGEKILISRG